MLRELDERTGDNLRVTLYWQDEDNTLVVDVEDRKNPARGHALTGIPPADARFAFEHPFAYGPSIAVSAGACLAGMERVSDVGTSDTPSGV